MEPFTEGWYVKKAAEKRDKERAVIEAAKVWRLNRRGQIVWWQRPLLDALEAAEKAKKEISP